MRKKLVGRLIASLMAAGGIGLAITALPTIARAERTQSETDPVEAQVDTLQHLLGKKQFVEAAANMEEMASHSPQVLSIVPLQWVYMVVSSLKDAGRTKEYGELLSVLSSDSYKPLETFGSKEYFRLKYA